MRIHPLAGVLVLLSSCAVFAATTPAPSPRIANGSWAGVLEQHPRLIGPRQRLTDLSKSKAEDYHLIKSLDDQLAVGIVHAVEGGQQKQIPSIVESSMKHVARGVTDIHQDTWVWLTDVAFTFDLFRDQIPPADRQKMIKWMNAHLDKYKVDENAFHNSTLSKILCYLRIAYATWGENPRAREFREYALVKLFEGKVLPVLREFGAGGGFTECGWYSRHSLWHLAEGLELARRFEGYDGFARSPSFWYQRLAYELHQPFPGRWKYGTQRYSVEGDGSDLYGGHTEYPRHLRTLLAQYFRGSELSRFTANARRKGSNPQARMMDFLYEEEPDSPLPMSDFPLAHLAEGIGKVYARSDWTDDATWLRFECGDFWNAHQHYEVGNFEIYRRAPLATESGEYSDYLSSHSVNWLIRTIAHNCILVYQPDEQWQRQRDGGRNKYANDGGQAKKWDWPADNLEAWKQKREQFERGDIIAYQNTPRYMYVAGDCTKAYSPSKLRQWIRQIVFLRPHTIIIFDRVASTRPEYQKTWLLHCRNQPVIDGTRMTIPEEKASLIVRTLLPENPKIEAIKGYSYGGQSFPERKSSASDVANKWRIEVRPPTAQQEDLFLHVLFTDQEQPVRLLRRADGAGVQVGNVNVVFQGRAGGKIDQTELPRSVIKGRYE